MEKYTITDIAKLTGGDLMNVSNPVIKHLLTDSRKIFSSEHTLFIAITGKRHNGHDYLPALYDKGVRNFMISEDLNLAERFPEANFIKVRNTIGALQQLASGHRNLFHLPVIGITGSNGKTIVKEWTYHALKDHYHIVRSPKSYNSQIGVPLSVWSMNDEYDMAIFEAGISRPGEMQRLQNIIRPDIGIFTNIGEAHQENFSSLSEKIREKLSLFIESEVVIYCKDHELIDREIQNHEQVAEKEHVTWSANYEADLNIENIQKEDHTTSISGVYKEEIVSIEIPFIDQGSVENAIHIWLLLLHLKIEKNIIRQMMADLPAVAMRLEMKKGINQCTLINDSYNSDLGSLGIALNMVNQQNQHRRKTVILSDILQSGKESQELYREVADLLKRNKIDRLIGIGPDISSSREVFNLESEFYTSTDEFISRLSGKQFRNEAILLKGSRDFHFEKISHLLEEQMHRTILEIDLDAMLENLNYFKSGLNEGTKLMAMVKAFSYGSGTYEIANMLQYHRVDYLGVAFVDEGVTLRESGISLPIVVMNPEEESFELMMEYQLEPEIYNFRVLERFDKEVARMGKKEYPVHLKLDTGMNRLGFKEPEIAPLIKVLMDCENLRVASVFSHLAASDEPDKDDFTRDQIKKFDKHSNQIIYAIGYPVIRHILNSAGIERFPEAQFDMVRLGIGLYGISATDSKYLQNISTFKSTVSQIKKVEAGETIGYGRAGKAGNEKTIAIIPVGYADGFNRALSNGVGRFYINGYYVPVIGSICMDMTMADITGCDIHEGDEVIIFGKEITVKELADKLGTIPYEIFTSISGRVKRIYYQE